MKAYFVDLRTMKVVKSVRRSLSKSEAARRYGVNCSTIARYLKRLDENGALAPRRLQAPVRSWMESPCGGLRKTLRIVHRLPALYKKSLLYRNYKVCTKITMGYKLKGLA